MISTKLIITAAHCVHNKKETAKRQADEASFYIGKHNLESISGEKHYIVSGVSQLIIHPEWNYADDRYDADIAIAVLIRTIIFTRYVKPICLWKTTNDYQDLIGRSGVVAGWGKSSHRK